MRGAQQTQGSQACKPHSDGGGIYAIKRGSENLVFCWKQGILQIDVSPTITWIRLRLKQWFKRGQRRDVRHAE